jgi:lipopolysaccharide transport system ATP-binding protein
MNMSETIIQVENLSKLYRLGAIGTGTLSHDLNRWWYKRTGKADLHEEIQHTLSVTKGNDYIWSLKDINFEIRQGEIFGIIGKNGAGKSTLLKLLSKISKPTTGKIRINGRVSSLLEVGTGFHPDLTGRENVFLNGAILGMTKVEIKKKFDEIVEFSGVERFIDTPVKRYSSGMYVRLAFAVAAHLEPEILIIDEVLAVGDAEFQRKCLGKIQDVSYNLGRTVLFVSHSIPAIKQLCNKVLLLEKGLQKSIGPVDTVLRLYEEKNSDADSGLRSEIPESAPGCFLDWKLEKATATEDAHSCFSRDDCTFIFGFQAREYLNNCELRFMLTSNKGNIINASSLANKGNIFSLSPGQYNLKLHLQLPVEYGRYNVEVGFICMNQSIDIWNSSTLLNVLDNHDSHVGGAILNVHTRFDVDKRWSASLGNSVNSLNKLL